MRIITTIWSDYLSKCVCFKCSNLDTKASIVNQKIGSDEYLSLYIMNNKGDCIFKRRFYELDERFNKHIRASFNALERMKAKEQRKGRRSRPSHSCR